MKKNIKSDLDIIKSGHIPGVLGVNTIVQLLEVGITLTIVIFVSGGLLKVLSLGIFDEYNTLFSYFTYLFGYDITVVFTVLLCGIFVIMAGRWLISLVSNNGGQTPNHN